MDKAKITRNGKITRTALLLLGKEESVHYLNHPAEIVWKLPTGEERAANIFYPPFLLSAVELRGTIRNYQIKIFPSNTLLPTPVMKYDQRSLLEGLHNCILHQDYTCGERIIVTESADSVIFQNAVHSIKVNMRTMSMGRKPLRNTEIHSYRMLWSISI